MAKGPVGRWFGNLQKIRDFVAQLNTRTADSLKEFADQKLGTLLTSKLRQRNLSRFCDTKQIGKPPDNLYDQKNQTMRWFLDRISYEIELPLLLLWFGVAARFDPSLLQITPEQFAGRSLAQVFPGAINDPSSPRYALHQTTTAVITASFYPRDGSLLTQASTVRDLATRLFQ